MKYSLLAAILFPGLFLSACKKQSAFDKDKWAYRGDMEFPYREEMLTDLLESHPLRGLSYSQLINTLGKPDQVGSTNYQVNYDILTEYGSDIDPIHSKLLEISLSTDSMVTGHKVQEWTKE